MSALEQKVGQSDIDLVNHWKALERLDENRPHRPMRQHYAELELLLGPFLRYAWAMYTHNLWCWASNDIWSVADAALNRGLSVAMFAVSLFFRF